MRSGILIALILSGIIVFSCLIVLVIELNEKSVEVSSSRTDMVATDTIEKANNSAANTIPPSSAKESMTMSYSSGNTEISDDTFVRVVDYIPAIQVELRYAVKENFTGVVIYDFDDAYLRYGTVKKLANVQKALQQKGYSLKIWDAFRPVKAQFVLWEAYPDASFVANPNKGYSSHSRGNTIDITMVDANGDEVEMPTEFDCFSELADRNYSDCTPMAKQNALLMENTMKANGFNPYFDEWCHFSDCNSYSVEKNFSPPKTNK